MTRATILICGALALHAMPALAGPSGKVRISGNATAVASSGSNNAVSLGWGSQAANSTGSIHSSRVGGDASARGSSRSQTSVALAPMSRARTFVGSIRGASTAGSASASGSAGHVAAIALRPGTDVCAAVGSVGRGGRRARASVGSVVAYDFGLWRRTKVRVGNSGTVC